MEVAEVNMVISVGILFPKNPQNIWNCRMEHIGKQFRFRQLRKIYDSDFFSQILRRICPGEADMYIPDGYHPNATSLPRNKVLLRDEPYRHDPLIFSLIKDLFLGGGWGLALNSRGSSDKIGKLAVQKAGRPAFKKKHRCFFVFFVGRFKSANGYPPGN